MQSKVYGEPLSGDPFTDRRRTGVGGSDAGAILGVNPWASALQVYQEKRGHTRTWDAPERVVWGQRLERAVLDGYAEDKGTEVRKTGRSFRRSKSYPFMVCHPDGFAPDRLLEVKTTAHQGPDWGPDGSDLVPAHYYTQVQHNLVVTDQERADLIVLVGGRELHTYTIVGDAGFQAALIDQEALFWQRVMQGRPPEPDGSESAGRALRELFPVAVPEEVVATPQVNGYADTYFAAKQTRDAAQREMDKAAQAIQSFMGNRERLIGDGYTARWGNVQGRTSWKDAAAIFRDLLIPHYTDDTLDDIQERTRTEATRRFAMTPGKDEA